MIDALHPAGFQLIGGTRIPMLMFGGQVTLGIDTNWHSHAVIPKTVIDLLGLVPFGIPRVDTSASLAGRVDPKLARPVPPSLGSTIRATAGAQSKTSGTSTRTVGRADYAAIAGSDSQRRREDSRAE